MSAASAWLSYEKRLVPRLAAPFADDITAALAASLPGRVVIDLAAGTGATAEAVTKAQPRSFIVSIDLDVTALRQGRSLRRHRGRAVVGDATRIPVRDGAVAALVCQQGLQFVPDVGAACSEAYRVLQPGGRLVALTWAGLDEMCLFRALAELADTVGVGPAFHDPCSLEPDRLTDALGRAGLVVSSQRRIGKQLTMIESRAQHADLLAHWVEAADNALLAPWRVADQVTREGWVDHFGEGLARGRGQLTAVLTVAHR